MEAMRAILARHKHPSIALLGEDLGAYGADIGSDPVTLLTELCGLDGDFSLEIQNFEPSRFLLFYPRLRALFAQGRIAKLHVAIQSGSDRVLRLMGRQYVVSEVAGALADLGRVAPGLVLETSFIINFPGEERPDFLDTLSLLPQFDEVVVFNFSSRYGTAAAGFAATVAPEEREARAAMIRQVQKVHPGLAFL
jgi:tRNA A37 methylthiotransferase MiaB